jgi:hypothetical protein
MKARIVALGCALSLTLALPLADQSKADGMKQAARAYAPVFTRKLCTPPARDGARVTWICSASEKCCYDWLFRKGTCVAATARCI